MAVDPLSNISPTGVGKTESGKDPKANARLQKATKEFEAIFLGYMLKSMRSTVPKSDMFGDSFGGDMLEEMFDTELAKQMSKTSHLGIGELVAKSMHDKSATPVEAPKQQQKTAAVARKALAPASTPSPKTSELPAWIGAKPDEKAVGPALIAPPDTVPIQASADTLRRLDAYDAAIKEAAESAGVSPQLVKAVITVESAGQSQARSPKNAKGLMQLIDSTATAMGVKNVWNPRENIMGGAKYLQQQLDRFDGDVEKAVAAYNAGPGAVEKHDGVPPFRETQQYVRKVMGYLRFYETQEATGDDD